MVKLMRHFKNNLTAVQIADLNVSTWKELNAKLSPIIGLRGVAALYKRTVYVTSKTYPWLIELHESSIASINLETLKTVFKAQTDLDAANASNALLEAFYELLTVLVGASLTKRLLGVMFTDTSCEQILPPSKHPLPSAEQVSHSSEQDTNHE